MMYVYVTCDTVFDSMKTAKESVLFSFHKVETPILVSETFDRAVYSTIKGEITIKRILVEKGVVHL